MILQERVDPLGRKEHLESGVHLLAQRGTGHLFVTGKNPVLTGKHAQMTGFSRHLTGKIQVQSLWVVCDNRKRPVYLINE